MKPWGLIGALMLAGAAQVSGARAATSDEVHAGSVIQAKTAGGYTYLKINEAGKELWLAALPMEVKVGDRVEYAGGDLMKDFKSKGLNQTFDSIRFVTRIHVVSDREIPKDAVHKGIAPAKAAAASVKPGEIARAKGGKTVAELFAEGPGLKGKGVRLRAKVVKFSRDILGKNWATLSDGTGKSPEDRIVATTTQSPAVGDIVTVEATVKTDVDLGAGYRYKLLLEEARFSK